jgi:2-C-methyl-D-erythritol 4-phosphate cytidylyltransferase/2-C-methyl-D-erythritol 2,4-cyclodiphosphate synthase
VPAVADLRVGLGFDVHPRAAGRHLWLGGLHFPGEEGLVGHSDGDVVSHALADAMLGAVGLGDVGSHFPDIDPATAGITGAQVLGRTRDLLSGAGCSADSCDVTVVCERPAIAPRRDEMRARIASLVGTPVDRVSVKATRPEGLVLHGDGIGCLAVAVVT